MTIRFIAEIGSNHNQSWERAVKLIGAAYKAGCWGVKFQLFKADRLYAPGFDAQIKESKQRELPEDWLESLHNACQSLGLKFGCTPFDLKAVAALAPHVDWLKVSAFDIRREDLIMACMRTGKPLMLNVGMARGRDIIKLKELTDKANHAEPLTLMHGVSNYPTALKDCHMRESLGRIVRLAGSGQIDPPVLGWSDHTVSNAAIYSAVRHGAEVVECHFDMRLEDFDMRLEDIDSEFDRGSESVYGHCWSYGQLKALISTVRDLEKASGPDESWKHDPEGDWDKWMADPEDGMRPLKEYREVLK